MGFAGTKRNHYTQVKIQKMRSERKTNIDHLKEGVLHTIIKNPII